MEDKVVTKVKSKKYWVVLAIPLFLLGKMRIVRKSGEVIAPYLV